MRHPSNERGRFGPRVEPSFHSEDYDSTQETSSRRRGRGKAAQKTRQLCRQAFRALSMAMSACSDEVVQGLNVLAVDPAPDAGRLLVTISPAPQADAATPQEILERLDRVQGRLRTELARSISRKRAPELLFRVSLDTGGNP